MTRRPWPKREARPVATVASRADWHTFLSLAKACVEDADREAADSDATLRLMTLSNRANGASSMLFAREAGAATADMAKAFVSIARAFSRRDTPGVTRRALGPVVATSAEFLDQSLHRLTTEEFQRAHQGRPEVYG